MKYKAIIFDFDGTLFDTLSDIIDAINDAMKACDIQLSYNFEQGKKLIGAGAKEFVNRALKPLNLSKELYDKIFKIYIDNYQCYQGRKTAPFPGVEELLLDLKKSGCLLFIYSNKPQHLLDDIISKKLKIDVIEKAQGLVPGAIPKPDPTLINKIIDEYNLNKKDCFYVGDSSYDIQTAKNIGIDCCLVTYGYEEYTDEIKKKANYIASSVSELRSLLF